MIKDVLVSNDSRRVDLPAPVLIAHQAEFMPWLGFISKAAMGDIYLILDDTQFKKEYFENRNKIRFSNKEGWIWLNIPVKNKDKLLNMLNVEAVDSSWKKKHLNTIRVSYGRAPYFHVIFPELEELYFNMNSNKLVEINIQIIRYAFNKFNINTPVYRVSELKKHGKNIDGTGTDLVISLVKAVNANTLVAGKSGKNYLKSDKFKNNNIDLVFQDFKHPVYKQKHGGFLPYMSFIDLLFNYGDEAVNILPKSNYIHLYMESL
jgi:hypothetical protein